MRSTRTCGKPETGPTGPAGHFDPAIDLHDDETNHLIGFDYRPALKGLQVGLEEESNETKTITINPATVDVIGDSTRWDPAMASIAVGSGGKPPSHRPPSIPSTS